MHDIKTIKEKLRLMNLSAVSREIEMPYNTLYGIATGINSNPGYQTIVKLSDFLDNFFKVTTD